MLLNAYKRKSGKFDILYNVIVYGLLTISILPVVFTWDTTTFSLALKVSGCALTALVSIFWYNVNWIKENAPTHDHFSQLEWVEKRMSELEFAQDQIYQESLIILAQIEVLKEEIANSSNSNVIQIKPARQFRKILENVQNIYPKLKERRRNDRMRHIVNCFVEIFLILKDRLPVEEREKIESFLEDIKTTENVGVASVGLKVS